MMLQAAVSLLNIGSYGSAPRHPARRGRAPAGEGRDLEQVRDAIDGVRALLEILERRVAGAELAPLRNALSQLQMAYAREVQAAARAEPPAPSRRRPASGARRAGAARRRAARRRARRPAGRARRARSGRVERASVGARALSARGRARRAGMFPVGAIDCPRVCTG